MPTKTFYLDDARTEAVTTNWSLFFRNFRHGYQGRELSHLTPAKFKAGREFALPGGHRLLVRLIFRKLAIIVVRRCATSAPGSISHAPS